VRRDQPVHIRAGENDDQRTMHERGRPLRAVSPRQIEHDRPSSPRHVEHLQDSIGIQLGDVSGKHRNRSPPRQAADQGIRRQPPAGQPEPGPPRAGRRLDAERDVDAAAGDIHIDQQRATGDRRHHRRERGCPDPAATADYPDHAVHPASKPGPLPNFARANTRCGRRTRPVDGSADTPHRNHGRQHAVRILKNVAPVRTAAFFDLDKTIIAKSSVLAFGRPFYQGGLINRRAVLRSAYAQFVFALAGADHDQIERMRAYLTSMCTGWDVAQVREIVSETLHDIIDPIVYDEAVELIGLHKAAGRDVVIVSTSGEEVVAPIGAMLGADEVVATRMVVADGKYTGEIELYAYGPEKASAVLRLAAERGYDLPGSYAYSDSVTDVPMLEAVGHPNVVNPDRALRKIAIDRDWPMLTFSNAVPLRERLAGMRPEHPVVSATVVGAGVAAAGLVWYASKRRAEKA